LKSKTTPEFWRHYGNLPPKIQLLADRCYEIWRENPRHPSLHFKKLEGSRTLYSARIGAHHRALADFDGDIVVWVWIGTHAEYDRMLH